MSISTGFGNSINPSAHHNELSLSWSSTFSFTPIHLLMLEAEYEKGQLNGYHLRLPDYSPIRERYFTSYQYTGILANVNLFKLFNPRKAPAKIVPYLYAGFGYINFESNLRQNNNSATIKTYTYRVYTNTLGCKLRYRLNPYLDLLTIIESRLPQTLYLDANPDKVNYDNFINFKVELCYKIACNTKRKYIEWLAKPQKTYCPTF
ncbi:MAG: hypothetical protein EAY81_09620 [Bacteroidetes bacterium]|nr:MAG: hypothetical protein EAY81_09620 [Bacteroidota bacterium]